MDPRQTFNHPYTLLSESKQLHQTQTTSETKKTDRLSKIDPNFWQYILPNLDITELGDLLFVTKQTHRIVAGYIHDKTDLISVSSFKEINELPNGSKSQYAYVRVLNDKINTLFYVDKKKNKSHEIKLTEDRLNELDDAIKTSDSHFSIPLSYEQIRNIIHITNYIPPTESIPYLVEITRNHHKHTAIYNNMIQITSTVSAEAKNKDDIENGNGPWYKRMLSYTGKSILKAAGIAGTFIGTGFGFLSKEQQAITQATEIAQSVSESKTEAVNTLLSHCSATLHSNNNNLFDILQNQILNCDYHSYNNLPNAESFVCDLFVEHFSCNDLNRSWHLNCQNEAQHLCTMSTDPSSYYSSHNWAKGAYATFAIGTAAMFGYLTWKYAFGKPTSHEQLILSESFTNFSQQRGREQFAIINDSLKELGVNTINRSVQEVVTDLTTLQNSTRDIIQTLMQSNTTVHLLNKLKDKKEALNKHQIVIDINDNNNDNDISNKAAQKDNSTQEIHNLNNTSSLISFSALSSTSSSTSPQTTNNNDTSQYEYKRIS